MRQAEREGLFGGLRRGGAALFDLPALREAVRRRDRQAETLTLCLLLGTLWLTTRPYPGIVADARFYAVEGLNALWPGRYAQDLYFQFGSQNGFSIYTRLYTPFLAVLGLTRADILLNLLGQALWLGGLYHLANGLFKDRRLAMIAMAAAIAIPGNLGFMRPAEPFLTPRLYAEALTLFALGDTILHRRIRAIVILAVATLVHPLMTAPGVAIWFVYAIRRDIRWLWVGVAAASSGLLLAKLGVQPFSRVLQTFDPAWYAVVKVRDYFCFLSEWNAGVWLPVLFSFLIGCIALTLADRPQRLPLASAMVFALCAGLISVMGGDVLHNVLIVDVQLWRAVWLVALLSYLLIIPGMRKLKQPGAFLVLSARFHIGLALGLMAISGLIAPVVLLGVPAALVAWIILLWELRTGKAIPGWAGVPVFVVLTGLSYFFVVALRVWLGGRSLDPESFGHEAAGLAILGLSIGVLLVSLSAGGARSRLALLLLSGLLLACAGLNWDQRSPWTKFVDSTRSPPAALAAMLPGDAPIYWEGDLLVPWFVLKRASYFSCSQGTGALFSRGTALAYQKRYERFAALSTLDIGQELYCPVPQAAQPWPPGPADTGDNWPNPQSLVRSDIVAVCRESPALGALVLIHPVLGLTARSWVSPVDDPVVIRRHGRRERLDVDRFYIYPCAGLR